jgi:hypothetical protein
MATINYAVREISVKIVYYGSGLCGKTTNLQVIHRKIPNEHRSDMVSLATETDRTLFFDFLPLDLGKIKGFATKFQLYTVPGQVYYNATRKLVLRGVDGVVFVVDSAADKLQENLESFKNLEENLAEYGYQRENIPIIIQYNKRDLPNAMSVDKLNTAINKYGLPWNESIAVQGKGIFESLKIIGKLVIDNLNKKYSRPSGAQPAAQSAAQQDPFYSPASAARQQQPRAFSPVQQQAPARPAQRPPVMPPQQVFTPPPPRPQAPRPAMQPPAAAPAPAPYSDPFQDIPLQQNIRPSAPPSVDFEPQQPAPAPATAARDDFYDYGSINLEPLEQPSIPQDIEVKSMREQRPVQESTSLEKTDLDLEIERYQREIEEKQRRLRPLSSGQPSPAQQSPSFPPRPASYDVYVPVESSEPNTQAMPTYQSPYSADDQQTGADEQPLYFTSVNTDRQKKPKKPPVNPKNRSQGSFFSKLFSKDKP